MIALLVAIMFAAWTVGCYLLGWEVGFQKGTQDPGYNDRCSAIDEALDDEDYPLHEEDNP